VKIIGALLTLLLIIVGIAFAALNSQVVELNYLVGTKQIPLAAVLLICLAIGVVMSIFLMGFGIIKLKAKNKWLETKLKHAQEQLAQSQH
jgi:putative membrane protein